MHEVSIFCWIMYNTNMNMDIIDRVPNSEETLKTDLLRS